MGFLGGSAGEESACNVGDLDSTPGLGRSPGEGNSYLLQYSGLENSVDSVVQGVTKSQTRLSNVHFQPSRNKTVSLSIWFYIKSDFERTHEATFCLLFSFSDEKNEFILMFYMKLGVVPPSVHVSSGNQPGLRRSH